jgi:hypothetical protein
MRRGVKWAGVQTDLATSLRHCSREALLLAIAGIGMAADDDTDGYVSKFQLRVLAAKCGLTVRRAQRAAQELVENGRWERVDDETWRDLGYLEVNRDSKERENLRKRDADRKDAQRKRAQELLDKEQGIAPGLYSESPNVPPGQPMGQPVGLTAVVRPDTYTPSPSTPSQLHSSITEPPARASAGRDASTDAEDEGTGPDVSSDGDGDDVSAVQLDEKGKAFLAGLPANQDEATA